ncbi:MAG: carbohydrate ABC transporter permease [Bacillota bacterium]|jgi:putative aldouronate transport system permease protein
MVEKLSLKKGNRGRTLFVMGNYLLMLAILFLMLIPVLKVLSDSLDRSAFYGLSLLPNKFSVNAYRVIITDSNMIRPFLISVYVTTVGSLLAMLITTLGAYVLAQKELPGRTFLIYMILVTMVFHAGMIPVYLVYKNLHLLNTLWAAILPLAVSAFNLILLKNFFQEIPASLVEAAEIDGCSPFGIFWQIVLPMSKPALATIGLFCIVAYWNDFFHYVIYMTDHNLYNFQVRLRELVLSDDFSAIGGQQVFGRSLQNAVIVVAMIPVMLIYPFLQKYFVTGITLGAVKG